MANTTGKKFGGRKKGTPNKKTEQAREAVAHFVEGNVHRLTAWLDEIAKENPKDAFSAFMSVVEYHIPKLQRSEHTGKDGQSIKMSFSEWVQEKKSGVNDEKEGEKS